MVRVATVSFRQRVSVQAAVDEETAWGSMQSHALTETKTGKEEVRDILVEFMGASEALQEQLLGLCGRPFARLGEGGEGASREKLLAIYALGKNM